MVFVRLESKEKGIPLGFWITTKKEISKEILEWSEENKRDLSKWSKEHKKNNDYKDIRIGILRTSKGQKMDANVKENWKDNWGIFKEYEPDKWLKHFGLLR